MVSKRVFVLPGVNPGYADAVLLLIGGEDCDRVTVRDLDHLADEFHSMNSPSTDEQQAYKY